ncbi:MAG: SDR family NAD(P)-dependent oxidoreductase [Oligoflexia bacterium]|nr:SDR family NAD(P)-dependent oxidoreductase [Oligoflexia bacterium]
MTNILQDKTILVTGASQGIGYELCLELLRHSATVIGVGRNFSQEVPFQKFICDLNDELQVENLLYKVILKFPRIDILINNAGAGLTGDALTTPLLARRKCFETNFWSQVQIIDKIAPLMIKQQQGTIVNISSVLANYAFPEWSFYSAAKASLSSYSEALRAELKPYGIRVVLVHPGNTNTNFHRSCDNSNSSKKGMDPNYVAKKVLLALKENKRSYLTIGLGAKILSSIPKFLRPSLDPLFTAPKSNNSAYLVHLDQKCRYHRTSDLSFRKQLVPTGMDKNIFFLLYPYLLASAYGGKLPTNKFKLRDQEVEIVTSDISLLEKMKNLIKTILSSWLPMGRISRLPRIIYQGKSYLFNLEDRKTICPAAFRSCYPSLLFDQADVAVCPDHLKNHIFSNERGLSSEQRVCNLGSELSTPLPCASLWSVTYPYYLTLATGGELAFYSKSFNAAIFQCPSSHSRVVLEICRKPAEIVIQVLDVLGTNPCPRRIIKGQTFSIMPQGDFQELNITYLESCLREYEKNH